MKSSSQDWEIKQVIFYIWEICIVFNSLFSNECILQHYFPNEFLLQSLYFPLYGRDNLSQVSIHKENTKCVQIWKNAVSFLAWNRFFLVPGFSVRILVIASDCHFVDGIHNSADNIIVQAGWSDHGTIAMLTAVTITTNFTGMDYTNNSRRC